MKISVGGRWEEFTSEIHLERRKWYHIVGCYSKESGKITLYLNGKQVGKKKVAKPGSVELSSKNIQIGRGKPLRPTNLVRASTFPGDYSFDGLFDEIKIFDVALSPDQV